LVKENGGNVGRWSLPIDVVGFVPPEILKSYLIRDYY